MPIPTGQSATAVHAVIAAVVADIEQCESAARVLRERFAARLRSDAGATEAKARRKGDHHVF